LDDDDILCCVPSLLLLFASHLYVLSRPVWANSKIGPWGERSPMMGWFFWHSGRPPLRKWYTADAFTSPTPPVGGFLTRLLPKSCRGGPGAGAQPRATDM